MLSVTMRTTRFARAWTRRCPTDDYATTLETDKPITLDGHAIPKGKYSVWFMLKPDVTIEFTQKRGRPMTYEWRGDDGKVFAMRTRRP